jgi:hypothetical protein
VRWLDPLPPEVRHFAAVRWVLRPGKARRSGKAPPEVEGRGCRWPMEACITLRCAEIVRSIARCLGSLLLGRIPSPPISKARPPSSPSRPRCRLWPNR